MASLFKEMMFINIDINLQYRTSKLPKFIKDRILDKRRNELREIAAKIKESDKLPGNMFSEYIWTLINEYPPNGAYGRCQRVDRNIIDNINTATFVIYIDDNPKSKILASFIDHGGIFDVVYSIYTDESKLKVRFSENDVLGFSNNHNYEQYSFPWALDIEAQCAKDYCCKAILEDIYNYFMDLIERSGRII